MTDKELSKKIAVQIAQKTISPTVNEFTAPDIIEGVELIIQPLFDERTQNREQVKELRRQCLLFNIQLQEFASLVARGHLYSSDAMIHITVGKFLETIKISFPGLEIILEEIKKDQEEATTDGN